MLKLLRITLALVMIIGINGYVQAEVISFSGSGVLSYGDLFLINSGSYAAYSDIRYTDGAITLPLDIAAGQASAGYAVGLAALAGGSSTRINGISFALTTSSPGVILQESGTTVSGSLFSSSLQPGTQYSATYTMPTDGAAVFLISVLRDQATAQSAISVTLRITAIDVSGATAVFSPNGTPRPPVSEPPLSSMMLAGLVVVGLVAWRRSRPLLKDN